MLESACFDPSSVTSPLLRAAVSQITQAEKTPASTDLLRKVTGKHLSVPRTLACGRGVGDALYSAKFGGSG